MSPVGGAIGSGNRRRLERTKVPPTLGPWRRRKRRKSPSQIRLRYQPGTADFDTDRGLMGVIPIIRAFRTLGANYDSMLAAEFPGQLEIDPLSGTLRAAPSPIVDVAGTPLPPQFGRPRTPGRWELAATAFVATGYRSIAAFCTRWTGTGLWRECSFGEWEPDVRTVRLHFTEIEEEHWQAFAKVANALIAHAHSKEPDIGQTCFGDATKWQSPARIRRVTPDDRRDRKWSTKNVLARANEGDFQRLHEKESAEPEPEDGSLPEVEWEDERGNVIIREGVETAIRIDSRRQYFIINGAEYHALDRSCGLRKIVKQPGNRVDVWFGGYALSLVDSFTGLRLSTQTFRADEQEYDHIPVAIKEITDTLGAPPQVLSVDKFSSIKDMYEYCTRRGIYLVAPYKGTVHTPTAESIRSDEFDEQQIARCPNCGGESDITSPGLGRC